MHVYVCAFVFHQRIMGQNHQEHALICDSNQKIRKIHRSRARMPHLVEVYTSILLETLAYILPRNFATWKNNGRQADRQGLFLPATAGATAAITVFHLLNDHG
jgi:hypothetical protein